MSSANLTKAMFIQVGGRFYPVTSLMQASLMFCEARDRFGAGASNTPTPLIVDADGAVIGHISYNGRVWPGSEWSATASPLYDNGAAR